MPSDGRRLTVERWVVVGAGTAGCVVARRLSDDRHRHVLLLDAGPGLEPDATSTAIDGTDFLRVVDEPTRFRHHRVVAGAAYTTGAGIGGSSVVNAMLAVRGDPAQYRGWGWSDVDAAWSRVLLPEHEADPDELGPLDLALLAADPAARMVRLTRRERRRVTSAEAYLWPVLDRTNLEVAPGREVTRVAPTGTGVRVELTDGTVERADRVVLSAGAIGSPAILLRSGLGGPDVGRHLADHPGVTLTLRMSAGSVSGGLVIGTVLERAGVQVLPMNHLGPTAPGHAALVVGLLDPRGTGCVRIADDGDVCVDRAGIADHLDLVRLAAAVDEVRTMIGRPPFAAIVDEAYCDDRGTVLPEDVRVEDVAGWLSRQPAAHRHATSTCAIGRVVDGDGRVIAADPHDRVADGRLYVCDASVFPTIPHANVHLPTTMLAERLTARWSMARE